MTPPLGAALAITIEFDYSSSKVAFQTGPNSRLEFEGDFTRQQLGELLQNLRADLDRVRERLEAGVQVTYRAAWESLKLLNERGWRMLRALLCDDVGAVDEAVNFCRAASNAWTTPGWNKSALAPDLVTVAARASDGIPVELLPLFDISPIEEPADFAALTHEDIGRIACRFLGFSAIVQRLRPRRRIISVQPGGGRRFENLPKLRVADFRFSGLPGLESTDAFFKQNASRVSNISWPAISCPSDAEPLAKELASAIWRPPTGPTLLDYFFCHCETEHPPAEDHLLRFHTGAWLYGERSVKLGDLSSALARLRGEALKAGDAADRPLIFLNACASAAISPTGVGSFPEVFADDRFLGFIGSETAMPTMFASYFGQEFITRLLLLPEPEPLGRALHGARWTMLRDHLSPLGLFYSAYGDPDLQLRKPVA